MPLVRLPPEALHVAHRLMSIWEIRSHHALAEAMFEGRQAGIAFVDDRRSPRTGLLCPLNGFYFVCGEVRANLVLDTLPEVKRTLDPKAFLNSTSGAWAEALRPHFARSVSRMGFALETPPAPVASLPDGLEIAPISPSIAQVWEEPGRSGLDPWVFEVWGGPDEFARRSFGFAVIHAGRPVAFTAACAIGAGEAEIEVGTAEPWRRRGLATASSIVFMHECAKRGLKPAWSADKTNAPSIALAARLGYRPIEEVVGFPLREA